MMKTKPKKSRRKFYPLWRKWVDALRSNRFKQGKGNLLVRGENGEKAYCCLGVLATCAGMRPRWLGDVASFGDVIVGTFLRGKAATKVGLTREEQKTFANINDGIGCYPRKTFPEIADVISNTLLKGKPLSEGP